MQRLIPVYKREFLAYFRSLLLMSSSSYSYYPVSVSCFLSAISITQGRLACIRFSFTIRGLLGTGTSDWHAVMV